MKKIIIYILRICILGCVLLPVLFPYVKAQIFHNQKERINVLVYDQLPPIIKQKEIRKKIENKFGKNIYLNYITYGNKEKSITQDYDDLLNKIDQLDNVSVIVSQANFFGEEAEKFTHALQQKKERLFHLNEGNDENYLAISSIFLPKVIFVNTETQAIVTIIGKAQANTKLHLNLELYNGPYFLNTKEIDIQVPENGLVKEIVEVPVQFVKIGNQSIIASLSSTPSIASSPLNTAFTTVQVAYTKTTLLHVGYGPNWNLRLLRWKLKFWPNLDLLSYYILREITSEQTIRPSELSLIEFPSEKLFGSELANLHGIIAQNFIFGNYLGPQETQNLVQYVKDGGRLVIQAGAASFLDTNQTIQQLYPCKNKPIFDTQNTYNWSANSNDISLSQKDIETFNHIVSHSTWTKCSPKENAIVLARLKETGDPILIAMPLDKGIIVSFLAADWLSSYTTQSFTNNLLKMDYANASDSLFQWMVEFLQRRQDSGIRAPEFMGPRLYSEDKYLPIKSTGDLNLKQNLLVQNQNNQSVHASPFILKHLHSEMLELQQPLNEILSISTENSFQKLQNLGISFEKQNGQLLKLKSFPVFKGSANILENKANPFLFEGIQTLDNSNFDNNINEKNDDIFTKNVPLLVAYPWLLALALGLLAIEQFIFVFCS